MADRQWLTNLANARYSAGAWQLSDDSQAQAARTARLTGAVAALYAEAKEACEIYNLYASSHKTLRLLPMRSCAGDAHVGLMVLYGRITVKLTLADGVLTATLGAVRGFLHKERKLYGFSPEFDTFGSLLWRCSDPPLLLNDEMVIKKLLASLTAAAFEMDEVNPKER